MNNEKWFRDRLESFMEDADYYAEELILELTEQVVISMDKIGINRTELAARMGVSKAFVTKLLRGNTNVTLKTIASLVRALGCNVNIDICPKDVQLAAKLYKSPKRKDIDRGTFTQVVSVSKQEFQNEYFTAVA